ncbi:MAG: hypothetical protein M0Q95_10910 [Porticoccaceae bacterium]|nr:hypothetical protein [Porticoccaceae bacterium]
MTDRYVHALWCDDIRQEVGNKPSFMGAYVGGITVPSLPIIFPKLSVYVWVSTPISNPFKTIALRIVRDDGFVLTETPVNDFSQHLIKHPIDENANRIDLMFGMNLIGVEIPIGCKYFAVEVDTESGSLESPKLFISVNPNLS